MDAKKFDPQRLLDSAVALSEEIALLSESISPLPADANSLALVERLLITERELLTLVNFLQMAEAVEGYLTKGYLAEGEH